MKPGHAGNPLHFDSIGGEGEDERDEIVTPLVSTVVMTTILVCFCFALIIKILDAQMSTR